jgi:hypothetical protein
MARLPVPRRRKQPNKAHLAIARVVGAWATVKLSVKGIRAARKGHKAVKSGKAAGRPVVKAVAIPVTVAGGVIVWRKLKNGSSSSAEPADAGRPLGPVASAETVSPPADAAIHTAGTDS